MSLVKITSKQKTDVLNIRWAPNNICNFKCLYCFPDAHSATHGSPNDLELIVKNFRHLFDYYKLHLNKNKFHLHISGGEPTLWSQLGEFIIEIKKYHDVYISIVSNASRTIRWWESYGSHIDNGILSFHVIQADVDHHIKVADYLYSLGKKVTVLILMDPLHWDRSVDSIDYMKTNSQYPWFIQAKEVVNYVAYSDTQKEFLSKSLRRIPDLSWFLKNIKLFFDGSIQRFESVAKYDNGLGMLATADTYINKNLNYFLGWKCSVGLESIYVDWNGDIKGSCQQHLYGNKFHYNVLQKDFVEKFSPYMVPVTCSKVSCDCSPETHITKYIPITLQQ